MKIAFMPDTHFGVYDQTTPPTPDEVADAMDHCIAEGVLAEKVGFDGLWVPERHQRPETWWPNATSLMMVLAAQTKRVQIASTVIQPTFHHPIHLAETLAAIDNLSRGRLVFGATLAPHKMLRYGLVQLLLYLVSSGIIHVGMRYGGLGPRVAAALAIVANVPLSFLITRMALRDRV